MNDRLVAGLDIGTSKVCAIIAEINNAGELAITGIGKCPSTGLSKGSVVNIEAVVTSISAAIEAAEFMSGQVASNCDFWTSIGGSHIESLLSRGCATILMNQKREQREVSGVDIERALDVAKAINLSADKQILDIIPQTYAIDGQSGIRDPLGMIGMRLDCEVNIITCSTTAAQHLVKCVNNAGFRVGGLLLQTLAAGRAVLTPEEKDLGCALIDLGGGTTNVLVYHEGVPCFTASVPVGGALVSNDICYVKAMSVETAEKTKIESGCCWEPMLEGDDIVVHGMGGRPPFPVPRAEFCMIIRSRMEEIFTMVKDKLSKTNMGKQLGAGIVLTGGGANLLGAVELAADVFKMPVRLGVPEAIAGLGDDFRDCSYATAVGLILEARRRMADISQGNVSPQAEKTPPPFLGIFSKLRDWVRNEFF